ncbi:glycosyltransferase family 4 protein [Candidatus Pelagibacter bacterium nBUS_28]|uniref:glycosyltransferase family 4 protein n=1 Tax=Candidatus Pelagibacter bacterium nBUS_28 TaxID=3374189 RepID=UPI003EBE3DBA
MKILVVSSKYQPEYSGSGLRAHNTYKRFKEKYDVNFDILTNSLTHQGNKKYEFEGLEVTRISPPFIIPKKKSILRLTLMSLGLIWEVFYSWKFVKKKITEYDLLHTFGNTWTIGFLSWYFSKKNKPIIRELCNDMSNPLYPIQAESYMKPVFNKKNTLVIPISKRLEKLAKNYGLKNIWYRLNPVNENKFFIDYKNKYFLRSKLTKFNQNDIVLNLVANFVDRKNQLFSIDVLNFLPNNFKLILAGPLKTENYEYFKLIQKKIHNFGLTDRVDIQTGFIDNFDEYLKCSDIFLFPSKAEGLGTPLLEAQACGVPVISNYISDITDTMIKEDNGGYFLELDAKKWAEAIQKVLKFPEQTLIDNANHVNKICSSKNIDEEYYKKIKKLINNEYSDVK